MKNVVTNALLRDIDKGLQTAFNKGLTTAPDLISTLSLMRVNSSASEELYGWLKDLPELAKNPDEIKWHAVELEGHAIKNDEFKVGITVPRKAIEDDQYGMFANIAQKLGADGQGAPTYELLTLLPLLFTTALAYTATRIELKTDATAYRVRGTVAGLDATATRGLEYNPITRRYWMSSDTSVNYLVACRKPA